MDPKQLILEAVRQKCVSQKALRSLKVQAAGKSGNLFRNSDLVTAYLQLLESGKITVQPQLEKILKKSRVRSLSGVSPLAVLTRDFGCPGKCIFCPTEKGMPKSYLSNEPAVMRAVRAKFDPFEQTKIRLAALKACGHETSKIELIVMGGTFSAHPKKYQTWFIRRCLQALNMEHGKWNKKNLTLMRRAEGAKKNTTLLSLQKQNESASHRMVGLTLETRPDYITPAEVKRFLKLGCTRVELGAQSTSDTILKKTKRGHSVATTVQAIKLLKNTGLKVGLHLMPNLPGATPKTDLAMFKTIFSHPDFAPDQLKIYPCVLVKNTELMNWYKKGKWKPYADKALTKLLAEIKKITPPWVRLSRVIRDIPAESIVAGSKITNLRQLLQQKGVVCQCIRCREIRDGKFDHANIRLIKRIYEASGGREIFLSYEDPTQNNLISLLRLRLMPETKFAFVRELHTYGAELALASQGASGQHKGFGKKLIAEAEKIAKQEGYEKLKIISGVGVRAYYRKLGYRLDTEKIYMGKKL